MGIFSKEEYFKTDLHRPICIHTNWPIYLYKKCRHAHVERSYFSYWFVLLELELNFWITHLYFLRTNYAIYMFFIFEINIINWITITNKWPFIIKYYTIIINFILTLDDCISSLMPKNILKKWLHFMIWNIFVKESKSTRLHIVPY